MGKKATGVVVVGVYHSVCFVYYTDCPGKLSLTPECLLVWVFLEADPEMGTGMQ